jgi:hypothetical protein
MTSINIYIWNINISVLFLDFKAGMIVKLLAEKVAILYQRIAMMSYFILTAVA